MDDVIFMLKGHINPITGALELDKEKTEALFRWLNDRRLIDQEIEDCTHRLEVFSDRFLKASKDSSCL